MKTKTPKERAEADLPVERFYELPDKVIRNQLLSIFVESVRKNYSVRHFVQTSDGTWLVKLEKKLSTLNEESLEKEPPTLDEESKD